MQWVAQHKKTFILVIVFLFLVIGTLYWFYIKPEKSLSKGEKILLDASLKQEKYRLSDAEQQKLFDHDKELALIRNEIYEGDPKVALKRVDDLISKNVDDANFSDNLLNYKITICTRILDTDCMEQTISIVKNDQTRVIVTQLQYAEALFNKGIINSAEKYYRAALLVIDKSGGETYLKSLNSQQIEYNYSQIRERAK